VTDESAARLAFSFGLAAAQLAIAFYVYSRAPRRPVSVAFGALGACLAAWTITIGIAHTPFSSGFVVRCAFASASLLVLSLLTFVSVFPSSPLPWRRWWYAPFLVLGLAFTLLAFTGGVVTNSAYQASKLLVQYGPLYRAYGFWVGTALVATLLVLVNKLQRSRGLEYLQLRYLLFALLIPAGAIAITNLAVPLMFGVSHLGRFGPAFSLVFLAVTAHAMIRQRLMDIRLVVGQTVSYGAAVAVTGLVFIMGLSLLTARLPQIISGSHIMQVALTFAAALAFGPATQRVRRIFDRYCYREPYDYNDLIRRSSAMLSSTVDRQQLLKHLFTLVRDSVRPEVMAAYLYEVEAAEFRLVAYDGEIRTADLPTSLNPQATLIKRLTKGDRLVVRDVEERTDDDRQAVAWLRRFDADCVFAIVHEDEVLAIVLLGRKRSGDPYFAHDLDLLSTITSQAAVAMKNAALYRHVSLLESQRHRAERIAESGALSAGIAHEIKNPLVAIRTFAELLPERYEDEEFRTEFGRVVALEVARLDRLVDRLRGLVGTASDAGQSLDVRKPLEETLSLLSAQLEQGRIRIIRKYDDDVPAVYGNPDKLKQLFLNLVLNAAESMSGRVGGGEITVRVHCQRELGASGVTVEIEDQGPGIANGVRDTLFHPFVSTKQGNSGLGLWVCRRIADEHNAVLRAGNREDGKGARFTIDIPVTRGDERH
jgi:nitrogen-specific signal transduction histidine kinase